MSFFGLLTMGPILVIVFAALGFTCLALPFVRYLFNREIIRLRSMADELQISTRPSRPPTPVVPSIPEQPRPPTPSRVKTPASSPPVIPLIIRRPNGATQNWKKPTMKI
jgi:hypothetical protein